MTEPLLRDGLSDFGRALFEAADAEAPSPAARDALLAAIAGTAAVTTSVTTASAAVKGGLAAKAGASASAGAGVATKGAAALGAKLLVASAISVATTAAVVGELREVHAPSPPAVVATVASGATSRPRVPVAPASSSPELSEPAPLEEASEELTAPAVTDAPPAPPTVGQAPAHGSPEADRARGSEGPRREPAREDTRASTSSEPPPTTVPSSPPPQGRLDPSIATSESASAAAPRVGPSPAPPSSRAASSDDGANAGSLGAQIASIDAARSELRSGNARSALATIDAFELRYGKAAPLSPEAMLVRVQAHLALGERRLAESVAAALIRQHPSSGSARRAASLVGASD